MRSSLIYRHLLALLAMSVGIHASSQAAVQNRITSAVQGSSRVALAHTVSPKAVHAADLGAASSSRKLENLTMRFSMTDAQQAALNQLLIDQQNPASPRYHQWLTPQQFGAQFGLSAADIAKVSSWLTAQGFTVTGAAKSSTFITFSGTVGQAQQAFGTTIHSVSFGGEQHIANLTEPSLPVAIAGVVTNISGLNDFRLKPRVHTRQLLAKDFGSKNTQGTQHFIVPGDFYTIYDVNPLLSNSINGAGVTIAVMGQVDLSLTDVSAFRSASGLPANQPTVITYGTDPGLPAGNCAGSNPSTSCLITSGDVDESQLDVEWAGAVAPSAAIVFVTSIDVIDISLVNAIDNDVAPIMSVSYGGCEVQNFSVTEMNSLNTIFQQANAEGITVVGPSGDTGATDCDSAANTVSAKQGLAVDFPASSPSVTSVGGTEFSESGGSYWNTTNATPLQNSAISYIPEVTWNDTASEIASDPSDATFSASGGGVSVVFAKPSWQTGTGVPKDGFRDVPDVSFNASADHDAYLFCAQNSCQGGTYFIQSGPNAGNGNGGGGTSFAAPSFAGILALVEQKLGGARIGNANPYIYALANSGAGATAFHDVTSGNNKSPCTIGSTSCPTGGSIGYTAGVGYDQTTGWGSIDALNFVNSFSSVAATLPNTTTTVVTSSSANPMAGQNVTFTAMVAHTSGSAAPTGSIAFSIDNGSKFSVTLASSGTATYTTNFSGNGSHRISALYSGDTEYYGSSGSTTAIVGPIPAGSIALSASPASITISSGANISSTITVTSGNGYAGTVNLSASAPSLNGSYSFSASPVTLTAGGSAKSTFSVAMVSAALKGAGNLKRTNGVSALAVGGGATFAGLFLFGFIVPRRKRLDTILSLFVFAALVVGLGCGSGSTSAASSGTGTYTITITGTDSVTNTIASSTNIILTIQ